ncbi:MAG: tyrosine-type recombinase/integrase [Methylotenera sp.]
MKAKQTLFPESFFFALPKLPSILRYYDEYHDVYVTINNPSELDVWPVMYSGNQENLYFKYFQNEIKPLIKCWLSDQILSFSSGTARGRYWALSKVKHEDLTDVILSHPTSIKENWFLLATKGYSIFCITAIKSLILFLCRLELLDWSKSHLDYVSDLPLPAQDKYSSVRTGDVFFSVNEESMLVEYIDSTTQTVISKPQSISDDDLRDVAVLICSYQFGFRPMQIGMLRMRDVRVFDIQDENTSSVHLTFKKIKQRSQTKSIPLTRKVKRDWAPIFIEMHRRNKAESLDGGDFFFRLKSSQEVSKIIGNLTEKILTIRRSPTELRHTAAQRLVDAGASHEELAEFMGHSDIDTGLVYFQTSPNQAERVNQALGISSIYKNIVKIAHDRFISESELTQLKGDQQIAGVPHGIAITGIGGCNSGQPACPYNPITSCYGCRKFMPINDGDIHLNVLKDMRTVVNFFEATSKGEANSPTYLQLKRTISNIQSIIEELKEAHHE